MPRPRKSTKLHVVQGTLRTTRHRDRENEPGVTEPLGDAPETWALNAKLLWDELADQLPPGVATKADRVAFELLCRLVARLREGPKSLTPALASQVRTCCAAFGMTPADRSRVTATRLPEENPFASL